MNRQQRKRFLIKVVRHAARAYLNKRTGTFLRKLTLKDADAEMAFYAAIEDIAEEEEGMVFDADLVQQLFDLLSEFAEVLREISRT